MKSQIQVLLRNLFENIAKYDYHLTKCQKFDDENKSPLGKML